MSNISSSSSSGKRQHGSQPGDDFAYQTRMVVYNFMGLVPSTPGRDDDEDDECISAGGGDCASYQRYQSGGDPTVETCEEKHMGDGEIGGSWMDDLNTLPTVSLIDRLNESVAQHEISTALGQEIMRKIKPCEPSSSGDVSTRAGAVLRDITSTGSQHTTTASTAGARKGSSKEDAQRMLLSELKHHIRSRRSPNKDDDIGGAQVTIIQKKNKLKRLMEPLLTDASYDSRRIPLSPVPESNGLPSSASLNTDRGLDLEKAADETRVGDAPGVQQGWAMGWAKDRSSSSYARRSKSPADASTSSSVSSARMPNSPSHSDCATNGSLNATIDISFVSNDLVGGNDSSLPLNELQSPRQHEIFSSSGDGRGEMDMLQGPNGIEVGVNGHNGTGGAVAMERQASNLSGGVGGSMVSRHSVYVDVKEVDDIELLVQVKAIPPISLPLKRELSRAINDLEEKYPSDELDFPVASGSSLSTPESEVADSLRVLGDRIQEEYGEELDRIVNEIIRGTPARALTYEAMQATSLRLLQHTHHGWTKVALTMLFGQRLVHGLLSQGYTSIGQVVEYTAQLIENNTADFIINNGGWASITELGVVETPLPTSTLPPLFTTPRIIDTSDPSLNIPLDTVDSIVETPRDNVIGVDPSTRIIPRRSTADVTSSAAEAGRAGESGISAKDKFCLKPELTAENGLAPEIALLRQDSARLTDEIEAEDRSLALMQIGTMVGLAALAAVAAYFVYRRTRRD